jgi:phosphoribosylaminoimidazole-succinocarboxamide synthase
VRDYLETLVKDGRWKSPPGASLPDDVVQNSLARYLEAYRRLTGSAIDLERF